LSDQKYYDPETEMMDRAQLKALQLERLQWQVERCYNLSPFYRERLDQAGVKPEQIRTLDDIRRIPVVTKQQLREEQEAHPPFGRYLVAGADQFAEIHPSTGTTGIPVNTIWSKEDVKNITEVTARVMWAAGVRPNDIIQNGFSYGLWVAGMSTHYAAQKLGCFTIPIGASMTERHIDYLTRIGSTVLLATPSFALYIAERLKQAGYSTQDLKLRKGLFGGEGGTEAPSTRKRLEDGLGIKAYDFFGLAEIGPTFACECEEQEGIHWAEDHYLVEVIDPETMEPCGPGETGILVITHLTREATPMLRYWTNDYATFTEERCRCGRTHGRSPGGIMGRADDMVIYKGAKFYPVQVEQVIRKYPELTNEFQIILDTDHVSGTDRCTIVVEYAGDLGGAEQMRERLIKDFKTTLNVTPAVDIYTAGTLERTTFKAKRLEDRRRTLGVSG